MLNYAHIKNAACFPKIATMIPRSKKVTVYKFFVDKNQKAAFFTTISQQSLVVIKFTVVYKK